MKHLDKRRKEKLQVYIVADVGGAHQHNHLKLIVIVLMLKFGGLETLINLLGRILFHFPFKLVGVLLFRRRLSRCCSDIARSNTTSWCNKKCLISENTKN
jgi:hypothetical protein